jgi:hypothetical protein
VAASLLLLLGLVWLLRQPEPTLPQGPLAEQSGTPLTGPAEQPETTLSQVDEEVPTNAPAATDAPMQEDQRPQPTAPTRHASPANLAQGEPQRPSPVRETPRSTRTQRLYDGAMTPVHRQLAMQEALADVPDPQAMPASRLARSKRRNRAQPVARTSGINREVNLNELTLANAFSLASEGLSNWSQSPVEIRREVTPEREVRTYELDILNLKITRKVHKKTK